ncbi:hypothetical protein [Halorhabdus tiamatea]|uniref:YokE-like PH domain-containing protein n=1 Tax=Halorhabdus tiamatea SARL4B TaxID=1033806 RepID=S6CT32_9EURY|nr:hypothetical protein [Halorhabdus tiamatea]CCQ33279.1 conserved hypothetical protein [Halorhabdus tiamatea SARL4B]
MDLDPTAFAELLENGEQPQHVLASDSVEHETDGRTTTVEPEGDHAAYLLVTDERVVILLGDQPDEAEIAFEMDTITTCDVDSGLLNETVVVGHDAESVTFSPTAGDLETTATYVETVAETYRTVEGAIETAMERLEALEERIREDEPTENRLVRTRSKLSEARHEAANAELAPREKLGERVTEAEAEFERRYVTTWLDRGEEALETAESASEGDYETFCEAYTTAATAADTLGNVDERFDHVPESLLDRVDALVEGVSGLDTRYVEATRNAIDAAEDADDPETAVSHWLEAYRRYAAAHEADWERTADLPELSTEYELEDVAEHTVEALVEHAEQLEDEGENREDEDAEAARSLYEDAAERLKSAQGIAEEWTSVDSADAFETQLATLEEKVDRTKWEWGSPGDTE